MSTEFGWELSPEIMSRINEVATAAAIGECRERAQSVFEHTVDAIVTVIFECIRLINDHKSAEAKHLWHEHTGLSGNRLFYILKGPKQ